MPQIQMRPRSEPFTYSCVAPQAAGQCALDGLPDRRWPLWLGRFGLLTAIGAAVFLFVEAMGNVERRELLTMSVLAMAVLGIVFLTWAHETINLAGK